MEQALYMLYVDVEDQSTYYHDNEISSTQLKGKTSTLENVVL